MAPARDSLSIEAVTWDARAEVDVGVYIIRYLHDFPPPDGNRLAGDLDKWGQNLLADGRARLSEVGARPLRQIAGDQTARGPTL